jgi:hypothetical protein
MPTAIPCCDAQTAERFQAAFVRLARRAPSSALRPRRGRGWARPRTRTPHLSGNERRVPQPIGSLHRSTPFATLLSSVTPAAPGGAVFQFERNSKNRLQAWVVDLLDVASEGRTTGHWIGVRKGVAYLGAGASKIGKRGSRDIAAESVNLACNGKNDISVSIREGNSESKDGKLPVPHPTKHVVDGSQAVRPRWIGARRSRIGRPTSTCIPPFLTATPRPLSRFRPPDFRPPLFAWPVGQVWR